MEGHVGGACVSRGAASSCNSTTTSTSGDTGTHTFSSPPSYSSSSSHISPLHSSLGDRRGYAHLHVPSLIERVVSGALTGLFALIGFFIGAVAGALAGRVSNTGVLRGVGLGAIAGTILSFELLDISRTYWFPEQSASWNTISMVDFIGEILHDRLLQEQFIPSTLTTYHWQVGVTNLNRDEIFDEDMLKGLSIESPNELPYHTLMDVKKDDLREKICCTICLQDIEVGETVRSLPLCSHTFHLSCIDRWLAGHGLCPVCRSEVYISS